MNRISKFLRSLDWRVLFAVPTLSVLFGIANNLRVPESQRVTWSGELMDVAPLEAASPDVKRGAWTSDFVAATNAAEAAHLPVVVVVMLPGCPSCMRFRKEAQREKVKAWQKNLDWYFVLVSSEESPEALSYVKNTPDRNTTPPYVGVYWKRDDGVRVMRNFPARSKLMGVPDEQYLIVEWMHAVEASVPTAPGVSFVLEQAVDAQNAAKAKSERGRSALGKGKMSSKFRRRAGNAKGGPKKPDMEVK